ncbi:MAG: ABC transporter ATP-binding protein [Alcanivorax sp.]|nr:ABC transporter ATP-binding protein [Alcanivorax sp.]
MIHLENLTRRYGDFVAVSNLSCKIQPGEIVGLLGRNGAGKTTTMKMLTGALEPDSGTVSIDGQDMAEHRQALQRRIGYLPENCPVYPEMTVVEYLHYRATLLDVPAQQRMPAIRQAVRKAELEAKLLSPISTLSRGYRQRVGVAQAIIHNPDIVILDEPTNGLDPQQIRHMRDLIQELARSATVIVSTHILQEVEAVCQRVLVLRHGELVVDTPLSSLAEGQQLLVGTDADEQQLQALLGNLPGVTGIRADHDHQRFELALDQHADEVAPRVARALIEQGHQLFQLQPRSQDLETLFREVNEHQPQEEAHA